jgi:hypothetical protein
VTKKKQENPESGTKAFFVVGDSAHTRFEALTEKLLKVPKEEVDEKRAEREREKKRTE